MNISDGLAFDDLLLKPKYSEVKSRALVDLSVNIKDFKFAHPIIPANMKTITGVEMALAVAKSGGLALIHRFMPMEEQLNIIEHLKAQSAIQYVFDKIGFSIGIQDSDKENIHKFMDLGVKILCLDIAHADSLGAIKMIEFIKSNYKDVLLIAGNVATYGGAYRLCEAGADVVKCNIGAGSLCTTRIETGAGVPQMTALDECKNAIIDFQYKSHRRIYLISDGGITTNGAYTKALCFADMVMSGFSFSGCTETPGNMVNIDGRIYKEYVGSSTHKTNRIEGVKAIVPIKSGFKEILNNILEAIQSGCSYQGVDNLEKLKEHPVFVRITNAGLIESQPHNVIIR
jgi:IMP dehydrogenase